MYGWQWWQQTTAGDLQAEMLGTTGVFGRNKGLVVTFSGDKAIATKGVVTFPAMDPGMGFDTSTVRLLRGWVDMEAALQRYGDRDYFDAQAPLQKDHPAFYALFKAVESARVEGVYTESYPGAGKNLVELSVGMVKEAVEMYEEERDFSPTAIGLYARARLPGVFCWVACRDLEAHVNRPKIEGWVDAIETLESTEESFALAQRIFEGEHAQPAPNAMVIGVGSGEGEGDPNAKGTVGYMVNKAIAETISTHHNKITYEDDDKNGPYLPFTTQYDNTFHWKAGTMLEDVNFYLGMKGSMDAQLATAKRKLEMMIQATQRISWDTLKDRGRLDSKRLVSAYNGAPNVFKVKRDASDLDTAVALSVDMSGSMHGANSKNAMRAAIVLSELLAKIGVPFEVTGFNTYPHKNMPESVQDGINSQNSSTRRKYGRVWPLAHYEMKRMGDRFFDARKFMHTIVNCERRGANADGESIMAVAKRLEKRPEKRKILFVISDGQPSDHANDSRLFGHLQRTVKGIERRMEVVGIGVEDSSVAQFYKTYVVLEDGDMLPTTMLNLLAEKLLPGKKKRGGAVTPPPPPKSPEVEILF